MLQLEATGNPFEIIVRMLERMAQPTSEEQQRVADAVTTGLEENFNSESGGGSAWADLHPITVAQRRRQGYGPEHPILVRSGEYRATWLSPSSPDHIQVFETTGSGWSINVGSASDKTKVLEQGGTVTIGKRTADVPARPVRFLSPAAKDKVNETIADIMRSIRTSMIQ